MAQRTPLYQAHLDSGARMVNFGGWDMPINYGSQIEEHHQVRRDAGLFDVSHMTVVDLHGEQVVAFLRHLLANDVDKLKQPGKAMYTCMLTPEGGVVDDLIVYFMHQQWFRMVVNAATRDKDVNWLKRHAQTFEVEVKERPELAIVAVQGPQARQRFADSQNSAVAEAALALKRFSATQIGDLLIARTGYTGEDGFELILPAADAPALWQALVAGGVLPCGLGARDTLRLEAGMNLYGQDMDEDTSPLEAALGWTIAWAPEERDFIGREALLEQKSAGVQRALVGLVLEGKGVLRHGQIVHTAEGAGIITSGSFSPTLNESIALARIPKGVSGTVEVEIRGRHLKARIVRPPFVRDGQRCDGI